MSATSMGLCKYCGQEFAKGGMGRHLNSCPDRKAAMEPAEGEDTCQYVQLLISGKKEPDYWLIVDARADETLDALDVFLREIWLECCAHMSAFKIAGRRYEIRLGEDYYMFGTPPKNLGITLKQAFGGVDKASYAYDFGSTTDLTIKVQGWHTGKCLEEPITVLSRNIPPVLKCCECGKPAEWVNPQLIWRDPEHAMYCTKCIRKAAYEGDPDYDEEADYDDDDIFEEYLPVTNSPRCGVCAYEGSIVYPEEFVPDKLPSPKKTAKEKV